MPRILSVFLTLTVLCIGAPALSQIETFPDPYASNPAIHPNVQATDLGNGIQPYGSNQNNAAFTVNWPQPNITWGQIQQTFLTHPNVSLFIFHFPNGFNWKVDSTALQSLYTNMVGTATAMGMIGAADLNFSSTTQQMTITCCVAYTSQPYTR